MNLDSGERLVSMARVAERDEESFDGEASPESAASKGNGAEAGSSVAEQTETEDDTDA
jgi:hypothetical protein